MLRLATAYLVGAISAAVCLTPPASAAIYYVGDQSTARDNNGTASYHDALNWLNYHSPGGIVAGSNPARNDDGDGPNVPGNGQAVFDLATDHRPNNDGNPPPAGDGYGQPTYLYFGDFDDSRPLPSSSKLVPGGIARPSFVDIWTGTYTFDLGSNNGGATGGLEIVVPQIYTGAALGIGLRQQSSTLNIKGGGTAHLVGRFVAGGEAGSTGTLNLTGMGTVFDLHGTSEVGTGKTNGHVVIKDGATFISRPGPGGGGWVQVGENSPFAGYENFSVGTLKIETGGTLTDSTSLYIQGAHSEFSVLSSGAASTPYLSLSSGAKGKVDGVNSILTVTSSLSVNTASSLVVSSSGNLITPNASISGTLSLNQGSISATSLNISSGGTLDGNGNIHGNVVNSGRISPGMSPGMIHIEGDYTQNPSGVLELEIGSPSGATAIPGVDFDLLDVTGALTLNGAIKVSFLNGYVPNIHDHFDLFNFGSLGASAPTIQIVGAPAGFQYSTSMAGGRFGFDVLAVPESGPSALWFSSVVGLVGSATHRRRL